MASVLDAPGVVVVEPAAESGSEPEGLYEVVDGRVVEKPAMGASDVTLASNLAYLMESVSRPNRLGWVVSEMLFLIDPASGLRRRPDVAFVSAERWPLDRRVPRTAAWDVVPDLAIEVISVNNRAEDVTQKVEEYFHAGVRAVWVIYPGVAKVYVYSAPNAIQVLSVGDALEGGAVLPGFRVMLGDLFGEPS